MAAASPTNPDATARNAPPPPRPHKIPRSVLVVVYARAARVEDIEVLLLERADRPGFWQSVTGSVDALDEPLAATAAREVREETAIDAATDGELVDWDHAIEYGIYREWRHRYAPGVERNTEHWFGLALPPGYPTLGRVRVAPREHLQYAWLTLEEAAARCFSPSNAEAILQIPARLSAGAASGPGLRDP